MYKNMNLRSACKGDCYNASETSSSKNHNHHHHHHHNHRQLESERESSLVLKLQDISKKNTDFVQDLRGSFSEKKINSVKTVSNWHTQKNSSSVKSIIVSALPSPITAPSSVDDGRATFNFSSVEKSVGRHSARTAGTINGTRASIRSRNVSKFNDYTSCDESDYESEDKTDYTYARSSSYRTSRHSPDIVPFPNMSRRGLKSEAYGGSSYVYSSPVSYSKSTYDDHVGNNYSESQAGGSNNLAYNYNNNLRYGANTEYQFHGSDIQRNLSYGLDSDSEVEDIAITPRSKITKRNGTNYFHIWLNIFDCIVPITAVWQKCWSMIYWVICSVLLLDSWILSWKIGKKWIFLPLLLLLLLLLLSGLLTDSGHTTYEGATLAAAAAKNSMIGFFVSIYTLTAHSAEAVYLTAATFFAYFQPNRTEESATPTQIHIAPQKTDIPEIPASFQPQLSREQVEKFVRSIVGEEMMLLTSKLRDKDNVQSEHNVLQTRTFEVHKQGLTALNAQIQEILERQKTLSDELQRTKQSLSSGVDSESVVRIRNLETEMRLMKVSIDWLQENQAALEANVRNCCRNSTFDAAVVEDQVAGILLQLMAGKFESSGRMRSEFEGFTQWLKSSVISDVEKASDRSNAETVLKAEAVARLAAAAAVRETLKQQEDRLGGVQVGGKLSEAEVRKIVHAAIAIYDADKTGLTDYALESSGGTILSTRCSETYQIGNAQISFLGIPLWTHSNSPRTVIQPAVRPGECWAFKGSEGYLVIQLMGWVQATAFSLEHIPRSVAPNGNIDSAPKEFSVYGLLQEKDNDGALLGRFSYDIDGDALQYFAVHDPNLGYFPIVELRIHSNHGNLEYTCLYRFRVHGKLGKSREVI